VDLDLEVGLEGFIGSFNHWAYIRIWLQLNWVMFYRPKAQIEQAAKQTDASSAANCTITPRALYIAKSKYWHKMAFILRGEMKVDRSSRKKMQPPYWKLQL